MPMNHPAMQKRRVFSPQALNNPNLYDRDADLSTRTLLGLTDGLITRLSALWRPLPVVALTCEDRRRLGGLLLPGYDGEIVARVATALRREPQLFRDCACDGDDLLDRQRVADRLDILRTLLRILLGLCDDLHLVVQGDTMRRALDVLDQARAGAAKATAADVNHHHARVSALSPALSLLATVRGAIQARRGVRAAPEKPARPARRAPPQGSERAVTRRKLSDLFYKAR